MSVQRYRGATLYPDERISAGERKNFCRRSALWRRTLPLQILLWLLIPGLSALGALYEMARAPFYRTVEFGEVFWGSLWFSAVIMGLVLLMFYAMQWRRVIAPLGAIQRRLCLCDESLDMECMPFNSQNIDDRYQFYHETDRCRERTRIFTGEVEAIHLFPDCACLVVYGPVHFVATRGRKRVKEGVLTGKHAYRVYCGYRDLPQLARELSALSGVPVREMTPRDRIPVEKQCKLWLI